MAYSNWGHEAGHAGQDKMGTHDLIKIQLKLLSYDVAMLVMMRKRNTNASKLTMFSKVPGARTLFLLA